MRTPPPRMVAATAAFLVVTALAGHTTATEPTASTERRAPAGCAAKGRLEVCFSSPATHHGNDPSIGVRIRKLFDSAGAGDTIRVAMFRWNIEAIATALIAAQRRGARVELVADRTMVTGRWSNPVARNLVAKLEAQDKARRNVVICRGACLPWRARGPAPTKQDVVHLKLILADIDGEQSVMTTSLNFEGRQYSQVNSAMRLSDPRVYAFSVKYWKRLRKQSTLRWNDADKIRAGKPGQPTAVVYPRRADLLLSTLRGVRCAKGMNTVDVLHAVIQRYDVRAELGRLQRSGCRVRIVVTRELIENWLQTKVTGADGRSFDIPDNQVRTIVNHDKLWAIHARWKGEESYLVVTGTSNATCGGLLYNDEMMLRLHGKWAWQQYTAHFERAYRHAHQSPNPGTVPVQAHCR